MCMCDRPCSVAKNAQGFLSATARHSYAQPDYQTAHELLRKATTCYATRFRAPQNRLRHTVPTR